MSLPFLRELGGVLNLQRLLSFIVASEQTRTHHDWNMANQELKCPKCGGGMVQGFVPDYTHGGSLVEGWHEGQPKKSFWMGTKAPVAQGIPIGAYRCAACGYLEFYADPSFGAD